MYPIKQMISKTLSIEFFRYLFVGGIAFVVDAGTLFALTHFLSINYLISAACGFLFGLIVNYVLSIQWVFAARAIADRRAEFVLFAVIGIGGLALNELSLWFLTSILGVYYMYSKVITAAVVLLWNFFLRKFFLFTASNK
ncbi:MAG: polysaccharide synthesis protein GtrA [Candidatus Lloydbacteria bacterium RIFCSPHIGHO2_02_FULL_54_17]|uniref:Polysaccharide synthesis protein GtrA n=1 Tax=Candidatus Lloydbacteria bacterium RIFCSPHIGHO2_02_FULL_54_17 TaxID=1798664 RepID=A0A1G2DL46_9BACT|nr:MAG: polysaccharide synthesis protein GtrA [Candidatus Lloydbacteria bacterium RIFCSPHIGHO2_01_FULL_54_11]OGZ13640.1 MAG: polysaccharide synthesis protein GtrA [Candidatus Lloydbacteria bacterium RIFCSPHIGHO2_02_FULL_54_17]OGZ14793.1 MAG: polysaccharide synthesis protein GtrA [Candidatus Lloydbacteria bacterium RIFCSPLOWO2_02_FULL_54_12]OGZ15451.1 MAG: polysaccharide synthesis protein GtrA [Candidatus Lloydbacteria bacterium RIFCSPLOWO2_01_FULL_54_18]